MDFLSLVKTRKSIRAYKAEPVPKQALETVLEAGRLAPSACNFQPWYFVVFQGKTEVQKLSKAYDRPWFLGAPVVIVVCIDTTRAWKRADGKQYGDVDAAIAMDHIIMAAAEQGLGTCWIGAFNREAASKALNLPAHIEPVVMTPLGYADGVPETKPRKKPEEILRWGSF
jgi:nitroreductase